MKIPTLDQIKAAISAKGYSSLFEVESSLAKNTISGEIPLDFLYKIVSNKPVIALVQKVFADYKFEGDAIPNVEKNMEIIKAMLDAIDAKGLLPAKKDAVPVVSSQEPGQGLTKLLFVGIRSREYGGSFDDLLIACTESGDIFEVFEVHTDLDYRLVLSSIRNCENPVCVKPGFYMDMFAPAMNNDKKCKAVVQSSEIDLYTIQRKQGTVYNYTQIARGNFAMSIGCDCTGSSDASTVKGMFCAEMKFHADHQRLLAAVDKYMATHFLTQHVHNINGVDTLVIGDMGKFPYMLLEEDDII